MAVVYAARQQGPHGVGRVVALKVLSTDSDGHTREAFKREATIATRLEHANVVRTYDVGEHGAELYIAMELVMGASLARARNAPTPIAVALRIGCDVLNGLHAAHELRNVSGMSLGLVHQDVTPQNIMIGYDGVSKLLDFGVARLGALDRSRTETISGKPSYLAPEQLEGASLDRRVDIFALGIVLFEMLSGERLFARDSVALTYQAILSAEIPDLRAKRPDIPGPIAAVVSRALTRPVAGRFASAAEMRLALIEARVASGIPEADNDTVSEWVTRVCPPMFSADALEREILDSVPARLTVPDVGAVSAAMPRTTELEDADQPPTILRVAPRRTRAPILAGLGIALVLGASLALLRLRGDHPTSSVRPSTSVELVASTRPSIIEAPSALPPPTVLLPMPSASTEVNAAPRAIATVGVTRTVVAQRSASAAAPVPTIPQQEVEPVTTQTPSASPVSSRLSVYSNVWGHVLVDGKDIGTSPLREVAVPPGSHVVTVRTEDGEQTKTLLFEPKGDVKVKFVF
jgi:serine/threonine-protein kinase